MKSIATTILLTATSVIVLLLSGCDTQTHNTNEPPIAVATVNQSTTRAGNEILLSSRNSDDPDGVITKHAWQLVNTQPPLPANTKVPGFILDDNHTARKFRIPSGIHADTTFTVELSVTDDDNAIGKDQISIVAKAIPDSDKFLTLPGTPGTYTVVAQIENSSGTDDVDLTLSNVTNIFYEALPLDENGELSPSLSPTKKTTLLSEQIVNAANESTNTFCDRTKYPDNTCFTFDLPKIDLDDLPDINKAKVDDIEARLLFDLKTLDHSIRSISILNATGEKIRDKESFTTPIPVKIQELTGEQAVSTENRNCNEPNNYYYSIDPFCEKTTLSDWKKNVEFENGDGIIEASYINGFDLGFGRNMFVQTRRDKGEVYSYVTNHPNLDSINDVSTGINILATVAMEFSPPPGEVSETSGDFCTNCYTKFLTFVPDAVTGKQVRVSSFDFDGRGEKSQPGTCVACHGGQSTDLGDEERPGDIGGRFMPWDVATLFFSDQDYENNPFARTEPPTKEQQEAFRKFNETVLLTIPKSDDPEKSDVRRKLIHGWYGSADFNLNSLPEGQDFNDRFVPEGWKQAADLYLEVIAPTCRACHSQWDSPDTPDISLLSPPTFKTYDDFATYISNEEIAKHVFLEGTMPLARLTYDNFWSQDKKNLLATYLELINPELSPGRPFAEITLNKNQSLNAGTITTVARHEKIILNGSNSLFSETYEWTLKSIPENSSILLNPPSSKQSSFSFTPDVQGRWVIELKTANKKGETSSSEVTLETKIFKPKVVDDQISIARASKVQINILANDTLLDFPITLEINNGLTKILTKYLTEEEANKFRFVYDSAETPETAEFAEFAYTVTDADGDKPDEDASIVIDVSEFSASNDTATIERSEDTELTPDGLSAEGKRSITIDVLANDETGGEVTVSLPNPVSVKKQNLTKNENNTITYKTTGPFTTFENGSINTPDIFEYQIKKGDLTVTATVAVTVNPDAPYSEVNEFWSKERNPVKNTCIKCHTTKSRGFAASPMASGKLDLNGTSAKNRDEIENKDVDKGSRINFETPADSLIVCKPQNSCSNRDTVKHRHILAPNSTEIKTIIRWIEEGAYNN